MTKYSPEAREELRSVERAYFVLKSLEFPCAQVFSEVCSEVLKFPMAKCVHGGFKSRIILPNTMVVRP